MLTFRVSLFYSGKKKSFKVFLVKTPWPHICFKLPHPHNNYHHLNSMLLYLSAFKYLLNKSHAHLQLKLTFTNTWERLNDMNDLLEIYMAITKINLTHTLLIHIHNYDLCLHATIWVKFRLLKISRGIIPFIYSSHPSSMIYTSAFLPSVPKKAHILQLWMNILWKIAWGVCLGETLGNLVRCESHKAIILFSQFVG